MAKTRAERRNAGRDARARRARVRARHRRAPGAGRRGHARGHGARRRERGRGRPPSARAVRSSAPPCAARWPASWSGSCAGRASWSTERPSTPVVEVADPSRLELVADAVASDLVRDRESGARGRDRGGAAGRGLVGRRVRGLPGRRSRHRSRHRARRARARRRATAAHRRAGHGPRAGRASRERPPSFPSRRCAPASGNEAEVVVCGADGVAHVRRIRRGGPAGDKVEAAGLLARRQRWRSIPIGVADGEAIEIVK